MSSFSVLGKFSRHEIVTLYSFVLCHKSHVVIVKSATMEALIKCIVRQKENIISEEKFQSWMRFENGIDFLREMQDDVLLNCEL